MSNCERRIEGCPHPSPRRKPQSFLKPPPKLLPRRPQPKRSRVWVESRTSRIATNVLNHPIEMLLIAKDAIEALALPDVSIRSARPIDLKRRRTFPDAHNVIERLSMILQWPHNCVHV